MDGGAVLVDMLGWSSRLIKKYIQASMKREEAKGKAMITSEKRLETTPFCLPSHGCWF